MITTRDNDKQSPFFYALTCTISLSADTATAEALKQVYVDLIRHRWANDEIAPQLAHEYLRQIGITEHTPATY